MRINDSDLRTRVLHELAWDPRLDTTSIDVAVRGGAVTLSGKVGSYLEHLAAERAAKRVLGVRAVANGLDVALADGRIRNDSDLALAVVQVLDWSAAVPKGSVTATVTDGQVRLEGSVPYQHQREAAQNAVAHLIGVRSIANLILVRPTITVPDLQGRIIDAFQRNALIAARRVGIHASGGSVRLTGSVHSWEERQAAEEASWSAPGVIEVIDELAVEQ